MTESTSTSSTPVVPVAETQTTETQVAATPPVEVTPQVDKAKELLTSRFARISKEEARLNQEKAAIAEQRKFLDANKGKLDLVTNLKDRIKSDPLTALKDLGVEFQDIAQAVLKGGENPTEKQLRALETELNTLKQERENEKKALEEERMQLTSAQNKKIIDDYHAGISKLVDENPEKYELIKSTNSQDEVWNVIQKHFDATKTVLSLDKACEWVEEYIEANLLKSLSGTKKLARILTNKPTASDKTLTGKMSPPSAAIKETLNSEARFEKALSLMKGK